MIPVRPRIRAATKLLVDDGNAVMIEAGRQVREIRFASGDSELFLSLHRYLDGRHSLPEISSALSVPQTDITSVVTSLQEAGLLAADDSDDLVANSRFSRAVLEGAWMWRRSIGRHRLFQKLESGEVPREVFLGWLVEHLHIVRHTPIDVAIALEHCSNPQWRVFLKDLLTDETGHDALILDALERLGVDRGRASGANPLFATRALTLFLSDIASRSTLSYLAVTAMLELPRDEYPGARSRAQRVASRYGCDSEDLRAILRHAEIDADGSHSARAMAAIEAAGDIRPKDASEAVNAMHDLKHAFDLLHHEILGYYGSGHAQFPRQTVDIFSMEDRRRGA